MRTRWFLLFLGFISWSLGAVDGSISPTEKKSKKGKPIKEEDNVLVLKKSNFDQALNESKFLLVEFYIALSGPSQSLAAEFAKAAEQFKNEAVDIRFGKVDVADQKDLKKEFNIQEYPTLKFFVDGDRKKPIDCKGVRDAASFVTWVKRRIGSSSVLINSTEQAKAFIASEDLAVIGFFKRLQGGAAEVFYDSAREVPELPFGVTASKEVFANFGVREDMVIIFQKGKPIHNEASEEGKLNKVELIRLIKTFTMDLVIEYNLETSVKIFDVPVESHIVLFMPKNSDAFNEAYENYSSVAPEFRGKIMFILVDTDETRNGRVIEYFRVTEVEVPAVQILNLTNDARYKMPAEEVSPENLRTFCQNYLEGKAKQHWSSEEIQEGWDKKPVKVLVAKNFDKVAFNKKNHVFVMFHAPWSHNCQKLFPVWEELGKMYESRKNVVIAKVDYTANEILLINLERYPFFRLFPAGSTTEVIPYKGEYTLDAFAKFLEEQIEARKKDSSKAKKEKSVEEELNTAQKEEL
ncbi:protein disulfide-isomerase-like protein of the testis [Sceloporus undulatus]|uniref:protein disulfide-isomerase-like protein of the testis n=1 Tax=Sceloporus undulatus TaxID=8520 RepID=UPI001C4D4095|nr:protein disulfide-isomerase-like protein of the testis [Sceloporus undulatus]